MPPSHHTLLSLELRASSFFSDATFDFADGLNVLMAGFGCGKTSLLSLVRFALGAAIPASYAKDFDAHVKDVLGPGTAIVRVRTQHGVVYASRRSYGEPPRVHNAAGELVDVSLDGDLFRIDAYAAKEIEQIAGRPLSQLELLDRFASADMRRAAHALRDVERRVLQSGADVDRLAAEIANDEVREAELPAVVEALEGLAPRGGAKDGDASGLAAAEARRPARGREQTAMRGLASEIAEARRALEAVAREAQRRLSQVVERDLESAPDPIGLHFRRAHAAVDAAGAAIEASAARLVADLAAAASAVAAESAPLAAVHDREDETYKELVVRSDTDHARAMQREALHRQRDELEALAKRLAERRRERDRRAAEHATLLAERNAVLRERCEKRRRIGREIGAGSGGAVRVTVRRGGLVAAYLELLQSALHGSGLPEKLIKQIADNIPPDELYALVERDDPAPIVLIDTMTTGKTARAHKVMAALRASGRLREIEIAPVDDLPLIELRVGGEYLPSSRLSTGQKCTSILPILLLPSANPLVVDQIEDHLDNRFIYGVLVQALVAAKGQRQFLLATHNPNIPVLADAERVMELEASDRKARLAAAGTVDETGERIEGLLEGGRPAFVQRGARYGHLPRPEAELGEPILDGAARPELDA